MKIFSHHHGRPRLSWRRAMLASSAVVALAVAGVATAGPGTGSTAAVSATFVATTVANKSVQTCTGTDGTYELTHATYSGTATSTDPNLNGALVVEVKSVLNTTKNLGWVKAELRIDGSTPGNNAHGKLIAVNAAGALQGYLSGDEQGHGNNLLASFSAAFTSAGGFTSGSIGTGTAANTAIVTGGPCDRVKAPKDDHGHHGPAPAPPVAPPHADDHGHHGLGHGQEHGKKHG